MVRNNGFLEITDFERIRFCDRENDGVTAYDWIRLENDIEILFKSGAMEQCYAELFWSHVLNALKIKNVQYDLAMHDGKYGVVTRNYNPEKQPTYSFFEILREYAKKNNLEISKYKELLIHRLYNVQTLNNAYEALFQKEYGQTCVEKLKKETLIRFVLQILLGDNDTHGKNNEIWINPNPEMAPWYDFGEYGKLRLNRMLEDYALRYLPIEKNKWINMSPAFSSFIKNAPASEIEIFKQYMAKIREINTFRLFEEIEDKIESNIPILTQLNLKRKLIRNTEKAEKFFEKSGK